MTCTLNSAAPQIQQQQNHLPLCKRRKGGDGGRGSFRIKRCPQQHLLAYRIIPILVFLCWLPDFIVALKDVSVTIPQAVKRGSNAMLTCNYDMENDTLYSVKWYKGRREFYRYTPKENPAMKVFPSQSGLNVERNLSNQSHVVLLAVPLNISGKFTCEISVEAPSFQTAMVSGEMEVVELPEEQATVTGIQPRYRIGDLVDGNCSIKYSKPAANLTWTINGIVVPPHHIKTYQIEKYEETNLESVMSAVHFMVTTQHFIKSQMRLKCTASIFDIFKEEIESIIEEDRPRIMASGQSYPPDHGYGTNGDSDGYEHNESYLTYFSAPKSSASPTTDFLLNKRLEIIKKNVLRNYKLLKSLVHARIKNTSTKTLLDIVKNKWNNINFIEIETLYNILYFILTKFIITALMILPISIVLQMRHLNSLKITFRKKLTEDKHQQQMAYNCIEKMRQMMRKMKEIFISENLGHETRSNEGKERQQQQQKENRNSYQDANNDKCQDKCGQCQEQQYAEHCLVANQNVVNKKDIIKDTNITTTLEKIRNKTIADIDCQHQMSQTFAFYTRNSFKAHSLTAATSCALIHLPPSFCCFSSSSSSYRLRTSSSTLSSLATTLGYGKTHAHDSFPLEALAVDASKSNNAKYMSKDQTLLMTSTATAATCVVIATSTTAAFAAVTSTSTLKIPSSASFAPPSAKATATTPTTSLTSMKALVLESKLLRTSVQPSLAPSALSSFTHSQPSSVSAAESQIFSRNNYLMAFIGELLLHQC